MLRVDCVSGHHNPAESDLVVDGTKLQYIICDKQVCVFDFFGAHVGVDGIKTTHLW